MGDVYLKFICQKEGNIDTHWNYDIYIFSDSELEEQKTNLLLKKLKNCLSFSLFVFRFSSSVNRNSLVVQNNIRPPNFMGRNSYELNSIVFNRGPFQFVVVPHLEEKNSVSYHVQILWQTSQCRMNLNSHVSATRLVSIIWFTSSCKDTKDELVIRVKLRWMDDPYLCYFFVYRHQTLTTLTSWDMETSNSTVTGSDTFSTGRMNMLYLRNNLRNNRSSPLNEKQPDEKREGAEMEKEENEQI